MIPKPINKKYLDYQKANQNQCTGFQDPTDDYLSAPLDLNELLIDNPAATYFFQLEEDSTPKIAIVDRSLPPDEKSTVIAEIDSELVLTKYSDKKSRESIQIWGVVIAIVTRFI